MKRILRSSMWTVTALFWSCTTDSNVPSQPLDQVAAAVTLSPTQVRGVDFRLKSALDQNFCIEVENGTNEGRSVTLQTCGGADTQRWAFPWFSDGTNTIVEAQMGMCLNGHFDKALIGFPMTVAGCENGDEWRFVYTTEGLIQNVKNKKCLNVPGAASNAHVWLTDCDPNKQNQIWYVVH